MSKYCVMPFVSVRVEDDSGPHMGFKPCCQFDSIDKIKFSSLEEYVNSPWLRDLQQHFLHSDTLPRECHRCADQEAKSQMSLRKQKAKEFGDRAPQTSELIELDMFPGNICNLTCLMCGPANSSAISAEHRRIGIATQVYSFDRTDAILDALSSMADLQQVQISGGEFFYFKRCEEILQRLVDKKIKKFSIITNGTVYKSSHIEMLKQFPELEIKISADGIGQHYDFVRYPAHWNDTAKNIDAFLTALPHARFEIALVLQPFSVFSVFEWAEYANSKGIHTYWSNILSEVFSWKMLTVDEKNTVSDFLIANLPRYRLKDSQKLAVMNLARNTLPREPYDPEIRRRSVDRLARLAKSRPIDPQLLDTICEPWPNLKQEIQTALSNLDR